MINDVLCVFLAESPSRRYEASAFDADEACFTYPADTPDSDQNFEVRYSITSDDISVHMNLRSVANNSIVLRRRLLPAKFKRFYEHASNLSEPYQIEFCAQSEIIGDNTGSSTSASAVISGLDYVSAETDSGSYIHMTD